MTAVSHHRVLRAIMAFTCITATAIPKGAAIPAHPAAVGIVAHIFCAPANTNTMQMAAESHMLWVWHYAKSMSCIAMNVVRD